MLLIHAFAAFCVCFGATVHSHLRRLDPFLPLLMTNHLQNNNSDLALFLRYLELREPCNQNIENYLG